MSAAARGGGPGWRRIPPRSTARPPVLAGLLAAAVGLAACRTPPPEAYVAGSGGGARGAAAGTPAGTDAKGEACFAQAGATPPADLPVAQAREVYCGGWTQPAARVVQLRGPADAARLDALAQGGLWRAWLEQRVSCAAAAQATTLAGGVPARLLTCTRRAGGWPHVAVVAAGPEGPVVADGVATALPVIERLAAGGRGGATATAGAAARSAAQEIAVRRLAAEAFGASDVGRYEQLMTLGRELNQAENYAAAEDAYRAALALQQRVLGRDDPNTVGAMVHLAVNLSNQQRHQEAEALFARAAALAPRAADAVAGPRLQHYRALALLNQDRPEEALALLREAEAGYAALLPPGLAGGAGQPGGDAAGTGGIGLLTNPTEQTAVIGLAEAWRNAGVALGRMDRAAEARTAIAESRRLLRRAGLETGMLAARSLRTEAGNSIRLGRVDQAAAQLEQAARRFNVAAPGERPEAVTLFLAGARRAAAGSRGPALDAFRAGAAILRARQIALPVALVIPYLDALDAAAQASPDPARARRCGARCSAPCSSPSPAAPCASCSRPAPASARPPATRAWPRRCGACRTPTRRCARSSPSATPAPPGGPRSTRASPRPSTRAPRPRARSPPPRRATASSCSPPSRPRRPRRRSRRTRRWW